MLLCGYAGSSFEVKTETGTDAMEIKTEADSNDISEFLLEDRPTSGIFAFSDYIDSTFVYEYNVHLSVMP